jgi:beta-lactamase regulating signal transducer with metallopeptidase domain
MNILVASSIDITILLAIALALTTALRRRSAAVRHSILAAAIAAGAAAPLLEATIPQWPLPLLAPAVVESSQVRLSSATAPAGADTVSTPVAASASVNWTGLLLGTWLAGALVCLGGLLTGLVRLYRLTSRCQVTDGGWRGVADDLARDRTLRNVTLLQSTEPSLVVTCGVIRPKIVLPAGSDAWSDARRRIVLAHELAHIRRFDWATQMLGEALRAIYWFHPLVWIASRRLRHESECACDDVVIARGIEATEYATHLLQIARQAVGQRPLWAAAPAIAHPTTLEKRISAMLKHDASREPLTRRTAVAILGATVALTVPVAAMTAGSRHDAAFSRVNRLDVALSPPPVVEPLPSATPPVRRAATPSPAIDAGPAVTRPLARAAAAPAAQEKPARISGTLYDASGSVLPGVALTLTDQTFGVTYSATTDANGAFAFAELQPATYELTAQLPGFTPVKSVMPIGAGASIERRIVMPIGTLQETVTVGCSVLAGPASPRPRAVINQRAPRVDEQRAPQSARRAPVNDGRVVPIRVGGQIRAPMQIAKANPICPNHVGVDTVVILAARIGIDGYLSDIRLVNDASKPATEIVESAMEAVRLWEYTPTLLNGTPAEANVIVTVFYNW